MITRPEVADLISRGAQVTSSLNHRLNEAVNELRDLREQTPARPDLANPGALIPVVTRLANPNE